MSLQVMARARAIRHLWGGLRVFRGGHRIWRVYRMFGFDTLRVFCTCGLEFTRGMPPDKTADAIVQAVRDHANGRR